MKHTVYKRLALDTILTNLTQRSVLSTAHDNSMLKISVD